MAIDSQSVYFAHCDDCNKAFNLGQQYGSNTELAAALTRDGWRFNDQSADLCCSGCIATRDKSTSAEDNAEWIHPEDTF